jgi:hypothetical protein
MLFRTTLIGLSFAAVVGLTPASQSAATEAAQDAAAAGQPVVATPLIVEVMSKPWAVEGSDGQHHLVYELRISNVTGVAARLDQVRVLDAESDESIATFDGDEIEKRFEVGLNRENLSRRLDGAAFGVLFLHVGRSVAGGRAGCDHP